jgi:hypothetical protein
MKNILLSLVFFFVLINCNSQKDSKMAPKNKKTDILFIQNDSIKYEVVLLACDTCVPISSIGYRVRVKLSEKELGVAEKISYEDWINLLNNNKTDWAANLILYYLFDKDAFLLARSDNRELWIKNLKEDDLKYWRNNLK